MVYSVVLSQKWRILNINSFNISGQTKNELYDLSKKAWFNGDFKTSEFYLNQILLLEDSLSKRNVVAIYNRLGIINKDIGKYNDAIYYYRKA